MLQGNARDAGSRLLVAPPTAVVAEQRLDLVIHALAQLPDAVELQVPSDGFEREGLTMLATAYGIESRIHHAARADDGSPAAPPPAGSMAELVCSLSEQREIACCRRGRDAAGLATIVSSAPGAAADLRSPAGTAS